MNIVERAKAPTPKFFRVLRTVGLALLAVSGSIVAAPVALPAVVVTVAGYAAVAGGVLSAVSQVTVDEDAKLENELVKRLQEENKNLPLIPNRIIGKPKKSKPYPRSKASFLIRAWVLATLQSPHPNQRILYSRAKGMRM